MSFSSGRPSEPRRPQGMIEIWAEWKMRNNVYAQIGRMDSGEVAVGFDGIAHPISNGEVSFLVSVFRDHLGGV